MEGVAVNHARELCGPMNCAVLTGLIGVIPFYLSVRTVHVVFHTFGKNKRSLSAAQL